VKNILLSQVLKHKNIPERLASYVYTQLPENHPKKAQLRPKYLSDQVRHSFIRSELLPFIRCCRQAGLDLIIFKGFYLAEFVYKNPSQRHYGDVDLLIKPEQIKMLTRCAEELKWQIDKADLVHHEVVHLFSPNNNVRIDVHIHAFAFLNPLSSPLNFPAGALP